MQLFWIVKSFSCGYGIFFQKYCALLSYTLWYDNNMYHIWWFGNEYFNYSYKFSKLAYLLVINHVSEDCSTQVIRGKHLFTKHYETIQNKTYIKTMRQLLNRRVSILIISLRQCFKTVSEKIPDNFYLSDY